MFVDLPRPKIRMQLPKVLGENELAKLFNALNNLKHKAILFTAYSAGLRVSEVINLQLKHVDSDRMQLFIECFKGKRPVCRPKPSAADVLRSYIKSSRQRPLQYVFESAEPGTHIHSEVHRLYFKNQLQELKKM